MMLTIEELLKEKAKLEYALDDINHQIYNYKDGFQYVVCVHSYGTHYKQEFNNFYAAFDLTNEYHEDNGFANLFTNNPDLKIKLSGHKEASGRRDLTSRPRSV